MRTLIKGELNPTLEEALVEFLVGIDHSVLDDRYILVPSKETRRHVKNLIAERTGGMAALYIHTIDELTGKYVQRACLGKGRKVLDTAGTLFLLKRCISDKGGNWERLSALTDISGFTDALWNSIRDMKEVGITPAELFEVAEGMPDPEKARAMADIWRAYESAKAELELLDQKDCLQLAIEALRKTPENIQTPVILYGIYDATNLQKGLMAAFLGDGDAYAFVPWYPRSSNFVKPFLEYLLSIGFSEGKRPAGGPPSTPFAELASRMFDEKIPDNPIEHEGRIELFSGAGEYHEISEATRRLLRLLRNGNVYLDEVAFILRSGERYGPMVREVLERAGIPHRSSFGDPLSSTPAGKALSALVDMIDPGRRDHPGMARLFDCSAFNMADSSMGEWGRLSRQAGIIWWIGDWPEKIRERIKVLTGGGRGKWSESEKQARKNDAEELNKLARFMEELLRVLDDVFASKRMDAMAAKLGKIFERNVNTDTSGYDEARRLLEKTERLGEMVGPSDISEFIGIMRERIKEETFNDPRDEEHGVNITEIMQSRGVPYRVVFIPGLNRRVFPIQFREDSLLLDIERRELGRLLPHRPGIDLKRRRTLEERFLFLLAVGSARDYLGLSYSRSDAVTGDALNPSSFFIEACENVEGAIINEREISALNRKTPFLPIYPEKLEDIIDYAEASAWVAAGKQGAMKGNPFFLRGLRRDEACESSRFTIHDGNLTGCDSASHAIRSMETDGVPVLSPSRLEKYARCPFAFFMGQLMGVNVAGEIEDEDEMGALELGDIYHRVLNRLYRELREEGVFLTGEGLPPGLEERVALLTAVEMDKAGEEGSRLDRGMLGELRHARIVSDVMALLEWDAASPEWRPSHFEVSIGEAHHGDEPHDILYGHEKPVEIDLGDVGKIAIRGRIDRIDVDGVRGVARIIDYKTGSASDYSNKNIKKGSKLQVPVYAMAAGKILEEEGLKVESANYLFINREKNGGDIKSFEMIEAVADAEKALRSVLRSIRAGLFHQWQDASGRSCMENCEFARACMESGEYIRSRKGGDAALREWNEFKGKK